MCYTWQLQSFLFVLFLFSKSRCNEHLDFLYHSLALPAGVPEILKKSLHSCSVRGGEEVFIIGKNFLKGTKVIFQENIAGTVDTLMLSVLFDY